MTLSERSQSCLRRMADLAEVGSGEWEYYFAEYSGLTGKPLPTGYELDERLTAWYERGREDRAVLLGLQSVEDAQT